MGMFDTVLLECPNCSSTIHCQSKSGGCTLETYNNIFTAPIEVVVGLLDGNGWTKCDQCGKDAVVKINKFEIEIKTDQSQ